MSGSRGAAGRGCAGAGLGSRVPPGLHGTSGFRLVLYLVCPLRTRQRTVLILLNCVLLQGRNEMTNCSVFQFFNGVPPFILTTYAMTLNF